MANSPYGVASDNTREAAVHVSIAKAVLVRTAKHTVPALVAFLASLFSLFFCFSSAFFAFAEEVSETPPFSIAWLAGEATAPFGC